jgi:hypothetical protein
MLFGVAKSIDENLKDRRKNWLGGASLRERARRFREYSNQLVDQLRD